MKFFKLIKFDFKYGIAKRWYVYCIYIILSLIACIEFVMELKAFDATSFTLGDCLFFLYSGITEYIPKPNEPLTIPYLWLLLHLLVCYFNLHYMTDDLSGLGQYVICRCQKRSRWWLSKCIWNLVSVFIFFNLSVIVVLLISAINNAELSISISQTMQYICNCNLLSNTSLTQGINLIHLILVPMLVCAAISMLQMLISLFVRPLIAYVLSIVIYFSSAYKLSALLLGNYAMLLRSDEILSNGVNAYVGIIFSAIVIIMSIVGGLIYFKDYNILSRE